MRVETDQEYISAWVCVNHVLWFCIFDALASWGLVDYGDLHLAGLANFWRE